MLHILRPYVDISDSMEALSDDDRSLMKLNSSLLIKFILKKMGWAHNGVTAQENDPFFQFYFNKFSPKLDFLLEYYAMAHIYNSSTGGDEEVNWMGDAQRIYELNSSKCSDDEWCEENSRFHRLWLLDKDRFWYKRKFREDRDLVIVGDKSFFFRGVPRSA